MDGSGPFPLQGADRSQFEGRYEGKMPQLIQEILTPSPDVFIQANASRSSWTFSGGCLRPGFVASRLLPGSNPACYTAAVREEPGLQDSRVSEDDADRAAFERFCQEVLVRFQSFLEELVLFGSRARGTAWRQSDWDVLAVTCGRDPARESDLVGLAFDYLLSDRIDISVKCMPVAERDRQIRLGVPFMRNVMREGKRLWTRTTTS